MEAVSAVIVGLGVGIGLAVLVALPLRRAQLRRNGGRPPAQARRVLLVSPDQRRRGALVAAGLAGASTFCLAVGAVTTATMFMLGVAMIGAQSVAGLAAARITR